MGENKKHKSHLSIFDLPIYRDYHNDFLMLIKELDKLLKNENISHKKLIENAYENIIEVYPVLNSGYNYWHSKGKLQLYNKVRILLSKLEMQVSLLEDLNLIKLNSYEFIFNSIKYLNGLIRKFELPKD